MTKGRAACVSASGFGVRRIPVNDYRARYAGQALPAVCGKKPRSPSLR